MEKLNYEKVFCTLVDKTREYIQNNNLGAMVLGISGGIDSTVVAAICHEVSKRTRIPLIGRSLTIKNKKDEFSTAELVGKAFCNDFCESNLYNLYHYINTEFKNLEYDHSIEEYGNSFNYGTTPISEGNIQARLRMIYLYNLASIKNGIVLSTDNQTEYQLGFWTLHGDVGDFNPLFGLWKTEVYELASYIKELYIKCWEEYDIVEPQYYHYKRIVEALDASIKLTPTDGLGISNSDLEQIGAKSYAEVDDILQTMLLYKNPEREKWDILYNKYGKEVVNKVWNRHLTSEFKRKNLPIVIERRLYD